MANSSQTTLYRIEPEKNMRRFYATDIQPNLFGGFSLMRKCAQRVFTDADRQLVREMASNELANGIRAGRQYDVQKLANVSASQQAAARAITTKDVSRIIEQARVRMPPNLDAPNKDQAQAPEQARERTPHHERGRDR